MFKYENLTICVSDSGIDQNLLKENYEPGDVIAFAVCDCGDYPDLEDFQLHSVGYCELTDDGWVMDSDWDFWGKDGYW